MSKQADDALLTALDGFAPPYRSIDRSRLSKRRRNKRLFNWVARTGRPVVITRFDGKPISVVAPIIACPAPTAQSPTTNRGGTDE